MEVIKYLKYKDKLVIADSSSLIELYKLGKIDYLNKLFKDIYTKETIKKECKSINNFPEWIKIEEPNSLLINTYRYLGFGKGESTAVALAVQKNIDKNDNSCIILDDKGAKDRLKKNKLGIDHIGLLRVLHFAFSNNYFDKEYIKELTNKMRKDKFRIPKNAEDIIFWKKYNTITKKV
jgi:predicted nucleic acid-binding protein